MKARLAKYGCLAVTLAVGLQAICASPAPAKASSADADAGRKGNWRSGLQGSPSLSKCKKRVEAHPDDADAQNDYGWALRQNGDLKGAEEALRQSIKLNPKLAYSHSNLSVTLLDQGKKDESLQEAKRAVELDYKQPIYRVVLGNALDATGDRKGAIEAYKVAIGIRPDYENAYYNLGRVLDEDGQVTEAKSALSEAFSLDDKDDRVLKLLDHLMK